jgi:hypothetical protein
MLLNMRRIEDAGLVKIAIAPDAGWRNARCEERRTGASS